jgi:DNA-binding MarR family transcriptional regulator
MIYRKTDWGGYRSDLDLDEKVMVGIVRASELFKKESSAIFKNYGLTFSQYNVLRILDGTPRGQNTVTNVSRIMLVSGPNMTGLAKRLEKNGFIMRKRDEKDERVTLLEITPKGKQSLININKEKDENIKEYVKSFSEDEKNQMLDGIKRILNKTFDTVD